MPKLDKEEFNPDIGYRLGRINTIVNDTRDIAKLVHHKVTGYSMTDDDKTTEWVIRFDNGIEIVIDYDEHQTRRIRFV